MLKQASKSQLILAAVLLATLLGALGYWVFTTFYEYYEEPVDNGYSDRYYREQWLAADRFIEGLGIETTYHHRIPDFTVLPTDETLFGGDIVNLLTRGQTRDLLLWIEQGGHLVFSVEDSDASHLKSRLGITFSDYDYDYDYDEYSDVESDAEITQVECLSDDEVLKSSDNQAELDHVEAELADGQAATQAVECEDSNWWKPSQVTLVNFDTDDGDYELVLPRNYSLEHSYIYDEEYVDEETLSPFYWAGSDSAGTNFMQFYHGDGLVTVLTSSELWLNDSISELDAAHVLGILAQGKLNVLESGNVPSLGEILWRYGSEFIVAFVLLILLWIAHHIRRFGPMRADHSQTRRSLSDHIAASSSHHWKLRNTARLIHPLQKQLQREAVKHRPGYGGLTREQQTVALIEMSGMPDALCEAAMDLPQTTEPEFVKQVSALKLLIEHLNQGQ